MPLISQFVLSVIGVLIPVAVFLSFCWLFMRGGPRR